MAEQIASEHRKHELTVAQRKSGCLKKSAETKYAICKIFKKVSYFADLNCYRDRRALGSEFMSDGPKIFNNSAFDAMIINIAEGNLSFLADLYYQLRKPLFLYSLSILHDYYAAEDVTQETFIKIVNSSGTYQWNTNAKAWIYSITRNLALNELKARKKNDELNLDIQGAGAPFEERIDSIQEFNQLIAPFTGLDREILVLRFCNQLKYKEIATVVGGSPGSIRDRCFRALKKLKKLGRIM